MAQLALLVDNELCFNCKACEVACKQENDIAPGLRWINVISLGPKKAGENLIEEFIPTTCRHCANPPCAAVCPTKAIRKRGDGIVLIDKDLCIGCHLCIVACPFGVIGINPRTKAAEKCTLCMHRVEKGLMPACVQHCEAGAIYFGEINDISKQMREDRARRMNKM